MNAAKVDNQLIIEIEPEIIVSGELEDHVMSPCVTAVGSLEKAGGYLHAEIVIRLSDIIKLFVDTRIIGIQGIQYVAIEILRIEL